MAATASGESVYNLVRPETYEAPKAARHISSFSPAVKQQFRTKSLVARGEAHRTREVVGGVPQIRHETVREAATMGSPKASLRGTRQFVRAHEKEPRLAKPSKFTYADGRGADGDARKPKVPANGDAPVMGLTSNKNFVAANAVENCLAVPKRPRDETADYRSKPEYGKVPKYLERLKREVEAEYRYVAGMHEDSHSVARDRMRLLPDGEREALIDGLKTRWEALNRDYQRTSVSVDSPSKIARKEGLEAELAQVEADIGTLSQQFVFMRVDDDDY
eukprot:c1266_g1_i1.p1 GENE.c1266_g1_i1~~c1266_g1_i1.p1  ORF type:complete len:276 (+),score=62.31 c1266_g1_i1:129-956(+)